jgi:serine-type D-Ala-D-Ala carboxypeptidase (penicillin-binding protein 5/6)
MSKRALAAAAVVLAASWGFSLLVLLDPGLLGSGDQTASPPTAHAAAPPVVHAAGSRQPPEHESRFTLPLPVEPLPVQVEFAHRPRAGILFDVQSGRVLWQHDPGRRLPIASLTKMITALIIARRDQPDEPVLITPQALAYQGSGVGVLPKGKKVPLQDLFDGLLLVSGNDAAIALAQHDSGSVPAFVDRMNRWRRRLGLNCSHFSSPSGILDDGNYSCPRDLAALARADLADPRIRQVVRARHARFPFPVKGGYLDLYNNNPFIIAGMKGITGLKTGYTDAAGRCYVTTRRRHGHELGVVLLNTPNPLDQVPALLRAGDKAESRQH